MTSMPVVSIIIRTLNEERYLPQLLEGIKTQVTSHKKEIVLIDSGSTDRTLEIARNFNCKILHIKREDFSFGRSLNWACQSSSGDFLALVSGHCIPKDNFWLQKLITPLVNNFVQYTYGKQIAGDHACWSEHNILKKYFPSTSRIPQKGFFCNNANSALTKVIWEKYKFDEQLTGLEDMHLAKRIVADGAKVGYVADAVVYHLHHENWSQVWRRFEREALALQLITPEVILRRRDLIRYFLKSIIRDFTTLPLSRFRPRELTNIFLYRYNQFNGSYRGNHLHRSSAYALKDSYFYPTAKKGEPLSSSFFK